MMTLVVSVIAFFAVILAIFFGTVCALQSKRIIGLKKELGVCDEQLQEAHADMVECGLQYGISMDGAEDIRQKAFRFGHKISTLENEVAQLEVKVVWLKEAENARHEGKVSHASAIFAH